MLKKDTLLPSVNNLILPGNQAQFNALEFLFTTYVMLTEELLVTATFSYCYARK